MNIFRRFGLLIVIIVVFSFVFALGLSCSALNPPVRLVDLAPPSPSSITCSVSQTPFSMGNSINVTGSISPAVDNATITLTYTKPDATTLVRTVTSSADGSYIDTVTPDLAGSWTVKASWAGNDIYLGSTSFDTPFTVQGSSPTGLPLEYIYVAIIAVVIVVVVVSAAYWYKKKK